MRVGIIGNGWVGKAMQDLFPEALVYVREIPLDKRMENVNWTRDKDNINDCDIAFICVPTPLLSNGRLDTSIVEECIKWCTAKLIVIRSTVNPGDCDRWIKEYQIGHKDESFTTTRRIVMQPEYLGETPQHPLLNENFTKFIILGGNKEDTTNLIRLYQTVYNANIKIRQVSLLEAEVIKLTENRAIAFKVMQCQELYDVCQKSGLDYYLIRDAVYGDDPRFNLEWTFIYPEKRGFNSSKCLVKDVPAWCAWAESCGYEPEITKLLVKKSNDYENAI